MWIHNGHIYSGQKGIRNVGRLQTTWIKNTISQRRSGEHQLVPLSRRRLGGLLMKKRHWTPKISSWLIMLSFGICGRFHAKFGCFCLIGYSYSVSVDWAWSNPSKVRFSEVCRRKESIEYQIQGMIPIQFKVDKTKQKYSKFETCFLCWISVRIHIASLGIPCLQSWVKQTDIVPTLFWIVHSPTVPYPDPKALNMATSNFDDWILRCLPNANWVILLVQCWSWMKNPFNHMNCYKNLLLNA